MFIPKLLCCGIWLLYAVVAEARPPADSVTSFSAPGPATTLHLRPDTLRYAVVSDSKADFGLTNSWCYLVWKLQGKPADLILSIDNTSLDSVQLYQLFPEALPVLLYSGGNHLPYDNHRAYVWHTAAVSAGTEPAYYLAAFRAMGKNVNVGYQLLGATELAQRYRSFDRLIWLYLGVVLVMIVSAIIGLFLFRNVALGYYALYLGFISCWILAHYGYLFPMLYPQWPGFNEIVKPVAIQLALFSMLRMLWQLFAAQLQAKAIRLFLQAFSLAIPLLLGVLLVSLLWQPGGFIPAWMNVVWHLYLLLGAGSILGLLAWLFNKDSTARFFCLAVACVSLMTLLQVFSNAGLLQSYWLNDHGILLGILLEAGILTYAIFLKLWKDKQAVLLKVNRLEEEHGKVLEQLLMIQDTERKRIAGDLHDSVGPMLTALKMNYLRIIRVSQGVQEELIRSTEAIIDSSIAGIRDIAHRLMPRNLVSKGLIVALSDYGRDLFSLYQISFDFKHQVVQSPGEELQMLIYRITCELLMNAAKHAQCQQVLLRLQITDQEIHITVKDNGKGFNADDALSHSFGLSNVVNRVKYARGVIQILSGEGKGTEVLIAMPVERS
ncbi:7TM diverse intracellular signaling domain-containing protein [Chitinophaga sp. 212800010-3]|uniref:7TM diverse intracellular signaling domain-containing protein n=1 Tax=unclassified Chitinophaga TaxID=2619133 RepID=UPI002DF569DB|nr:hypothetical protein [Chitinophaga sp. 212800010-3]